VPGRHEVITLTLYSRPGCHLCDEMKAVINRVAQSNPLQLEEIDISANADLEARYGLEIPVLMVEGRKAAKYRIGEAELRKLLAARAQAGQAGEAG
jgi:glutaredoxin